MREIFTAELAALGKDLTTMSELVHSAIDRAGRALLTGDLALAEDVIAADHEIDAFERDLDERCVLLIAQQQPVAGDLRIVISALRMSASLERMGDLARHLAELTRLRYPAPVVPTPLVGLFSQMHDGATRIAGELTTVLDNRDVAMAESMDSDDDLLDRLHDETFAATLGGQYDLTPQQVVDVTLAARYFERFGDHAVSVADRVVYLVTGVERGHHS
jgi:phosphate transport system protein